MHGTFATKFLRFLAAFVIIVIIIIIIIIIKSPRDF